MTGRRDILLCIPFICSSADAGHTSGGGSSGAVGGAGGRGGAGGGEN